MAALSLLRPPAAGWRARLRRPRRPPAGPAGSAAISVALDNLRQGLSRKEPKPRSRPSPRHVGQHGAARGRIHLSRPAVRLRSGPDRHGPHRGLRRVELFVRLAAEKTGRTSSSPRISAISSCCRSPAPSYGLHVTAMFRPPNNPYIADYILSTRTLADGRPARRRVPAPPSRWRASWRTAAISACWSTRSSATASAHQFFGRPCETSPLVPKLARQFECDVYPARCIRLPGNRFRLVLEERLELPRDGEGQVDVEAVRPAAERRGRALGARGPRASGCGSTSAGKLDAAAPRAAGERMPA